MASPALPEVHIRNLRGNDTGQLVALGRELWSEVMHRLDPDDAVFTTLLALGLPHWDEDLEDMPAFEV